jgi:hypothetical protein
MMKANFNGNEQGKISTSGIIAVVVLLALAAFVVYRIKRHAPKPEEPPISEPRGGLPEMKIKPQPKEVVFKGCGPEGDGGDPALNRLKNRVDEASEYFAATFDDVEKLPWPAAIERRDRDRWAPADREALERYEGLPLAIEGYLARSKEEGPESCNCHGADHEFRDFHVWLTKLPAEDRSSSIVVEITPRVRFKHPAWTTVALGRIARADQKVRISGWLMLDPEHPDQVGKTRGTIWEIHPVMKIEVEQDGKWVMLDSIATP